MGKHERGVVEEAEEIAAILINGDKLTALQEKHPFITIIKEFSKLIHREYKNIKKAQAVGNSYNSPGDILLYFKDGNKKYMELKFLEKSGYGTLANISQDALTLLNIWNCESWSSFRKRTGHRKEVRKLLNQFNYPFGLISEFDPESKIYKAASYLKGVISAGDRNVEGVCKEIISSSHSSREEKLASKIIIDIIKMDKASRKEYLSILSKSIVDKERLKKFVILLLDGSHTQKILNVKMSKPLSLDDNKNYDVYYLYKETGKIEKEYGPVDLYKISGKKFNVEIKDDETNLVIFLLDGDKKINLIRVVFHWKNKFGGIQTPCLNVFKF
jgi:hypothetical protein